MGPGGGGLSSQKIFWGGGLFEGGDLLSISQIYHEAKFSSLTCGWSVYLKQQIYCDILSSRLSFRQFLRIGKLQTKSFV